MKGYKLIWVPEDFQPDPAQQAEINHQNIIEILGERYLRLLKEKGK